ncbi:MAG: hypothetical protein ACKO57_00730, partial [Alphaproteobacteria bacterium]
LPPSSDSSLDVWRNGSRKAASADEVRIAAFRRARIVRDGMLNLPDRLAAVLAAEHDATKVHTLLTTEIRTVLVELSDADSS